MSMQGVTDEDRIELNKDEAKAMKVRSRRLLLSLIRPIRFRLMLSFTLVVFSQAFRAVGPALIAFGIDKALPQAIHNEMTPLFLVVGGYLFAAVATASLTYSFLKFAARTNQNVLFDLRQGPLQMHFALALSGALQPG